MTYDRKNPLKVGSVGGVDGPTLGGFPTPSDLTVTAALTAMQMVYQQRERLTLHVARNLKTEGKKIAKEYNFDLSIHEEWPDDTWVVMDPRMSGSIEVIG